MIGLFVLALVLWTTGDDDKGPKVAIPTDPTTSAGVGLPATDTPSSGASSTGAGGLPALPGFGAVSGRPNTTDLATLAPGAHRIVLTARSNASMLAVAYSVRGETKGKIFYNVKSPVVISRTITGGRPFAAMALQVSNLGSAGSCTITIDGKVVDSRAVNKPYAVMGCSA